MGADLRLLQKKGRKSAVGDTHVCGSCEVWVQLGSSATYRERHGGTEMRHPGNEHPLFLSTCLVEAVEHSICDQTVASVKTALLIV